MEAELFAFGFEGVLSIIIGTLFSLVLWYRSRIKSRAAGKRTESAGDTFFRQIGLAAVFASLAAISYFGFDALHFTGIAVALAMTTIFWGVVALILKNTSKLSEIRKD